MSVYTNSLALKPKGDKWELTAPLCFEIGKKGSKLWVCSPDGFITDLASIPWFARWAFKTSDARYAKASTLHDYTLELGWNRIASAALFADALLADGVSYWRVVIMGLAVLTRNEK